jgi:RNA polymerase sigma-70 factor (ECF subfamily)
VAAQTVTLYTDSGPPETAELGEPLLRPWRLAEWVAVTNDLALRLGAVAVDETLEREFEARLADSATLAFRVAYSVLRHREDAEDVAQEALAKAYKSFRTLRDRDRFRAWLVRTTWRLALDRRRNDRRRQARDEIAEVSRGESTEQAVLARERSQQLWAAIDTLPEKLRVVMVLGAIEGYDVDEVAKLLNVPAGTVKSRLFVGRQRLKDALQWTRSSR